jgi:hypothetical protein
MKPKEISEKNECNQLKESTKALKEVTSEVRRQNRLINALIEEIIENRRLTLSMINAIKKLGEGDEK